MYTYLLLFTVAAGSALILTPLMRRLCERYGWLDDPSDDRRVHERPMPRLGGIAIFAAVLSALATLLIIRNSLTQALSASRAQLLIVLVPATCALLVGIYDDFRGTNARFKFTAQVLVGVLFYALGGRVVALSVPLVGTVVLPAALSCALTIVWTIAITNAFNLIDGVDGLATGTALFATLVLLAVSLMLGHPVVTVIAVAMCGALIGFLPYNFNPASIFLGDSGSLFIGFTLAALAVQGAQKASTAVAVIIPLVAFGLPVLDTSFAIIRRYISGRPLFDGDREHIHHKLLERGWSQRRVVLVLYLVCALFGLLALLMVNDVGMRTTGLVLFIVAAGVLFFGSRLRYHEVDEVTAEVKRNLGDRRLRAANNIRVRRASQAMSQAMSLSDILSAVEDMLEFGEFIYATVQLGRGGDFQHSELVLRRAGLSPVLRQVEVRGGLLCWAWERGDIDGEVILGSGHFWTLRLPLSTERGGWGYINLYRAFDSDVLHLDVNYLFSFFQREMAQAAERVFLAAEAYMHEEALVQHAGGAD